MDSLSEQSQTCQQRIIVLHRSLEIAKFQLAKAAAHMMAARVAAEEAAESKKSLCEQLQRLVEDADRGRSGWGRGSLSHGSWLSQADMARVSRLSDVNS
jgi:hypothetical protein